MADFNSWQYARWIHVIARTLRLNYGTVGEVGAVKSFLTSVLANRHWLEVKMNNKANSGVGYDISKETDNSLAEMLSVVGRDFKKTPMTDAEKVLADALISATGDRRFGDKGNLI